MLTREETILAALRALEYPAGVARGAWFDDCPPDKDGSFYLARLQRRIRTGEGLEHG